MIGLASVSCSATASACSPSSLYHPPRGRSELRRLQPDIQHQIERQAEQHPGQRLLEPSGSRGRGDHPPVEAHGIEQRRTDTTGALHIHGPGEPRTDGAHHAGRQRAQHEARKDESHGPPGPPAGSAARNVRRLRRSLHASPSSRRNDSMARVLVSHSDIGSPSSDCVVRGSLPISWPAASNCTWCSPGTKRRSCT